MTLSVAPSNVFTRIESPLFRVLLQRRLRFLLPLSARQCRCGRPLDNLGHDRAACARAGFLERRGSAVESAGARICREAGGRVVTNAIGGAQLAVDTTLVSALHCDGSAHPRAAHVDGAVLVAARRRKERTYSELANPRGRAWLVVLAGEVGGRWSEETRQFLTLLAKARARCEPIILRRRAEQAWRLRWAGFLCCAAARAFAASLLMGCGAGAGRMGMPPQTMSW